MTSLAATAEARLADIPRYVPGREAARRGGKLSSNEAPLGPSPAVRAAISRAADDAHRYATSEELRAELAAGLGVEPSQIVLTNGSDELCYLIAALFIEPGAPVVLSDPGYRINEIVTRVQRGEPRFVPLAAVGSHDLDAMAAAAGSAALVWLPSPHNPTGVASGVDELREFLAAVPAGCMVVLDEAYRGYVDPARRPNVTELIAEFPHLVVQRTFSKDFALAGLRIGYGLGSAAVIGAIDAIRPPFNINVAAIAAARAALGDAAWREYATSLVRRERKRLEHFLSSLGFDFYKSDANFVTVRVPAKDRFLAALAGAGLSVRDGAELGLAEWLRITIGRPSQMAILRELLTEHKEAL
jgi:histidinol-phosphate aminotransferase